MSTGLVKGFSSLVVTRIFLGFFEGCLFPSLTLLLCNWYKREELAIRVAYLFSKCTQISLRILSDDSLVASALSGAFGGLLAFAILHMDGVARYPGWRW